MQPQQGDMWISDHESSVAQAGRLQGYRRLRGFVEGGPITTQARSSYFRWGNPEDRFERKKSDTSKSFTTCTKIVSNQVVVPRAPHFHVRPVSLHPNRK